MFTTMAMCALLQPPPLTSTLALCLRYREIVHNAEHHIRVFELLLKGGDWGESLPDFFSAPRMYIQLMSECCQGHP